MLDAAFVFPAVKGFQAKREYYTSRSNRVAQFKHGSNRSCARSFSDVFRHTGTLGNGISILSSFTVSGGESHFVKNTLLWTEYNTSAVNFVCFCQKTFIRSSVDLKKYGLRLLHYSEMCNQNPAGR